MPKNRKLTYSDRQSQAARDKKQAGKTNAAEPDAKPEPETKQVTESPAKRTPKK
jgi:hypothetical protein